jgi:hypothetical protein
VWKDPLVRGSAQVRGEKQEFLTVSVKLFGVQGEVRQALELERLNLVSLSRELGWRVHSKRSSSITVSGRRSLLRHVGNVDVL